MKSFSIVISTYNRATTLASTLQSLRFLRHPRFEVIVVNGPSNDNTGEVIDACHDFVRVGVCPEANISMSRNIGIAMAQGDIVAFLDDDAVPEANWLDELECEYLADDRVAAVGGFVRDNTGVSFQCRYIVCDRIGQAAFFNDHKSAELIQKPYSDRYYSLIGVNSSFLRKPLLEVGGFDEEYAYFLDETDVCLRLNDAGWHVRFRPNAEVHHKFAPSHLRNEKRAPKSLYFTARSKIYFVMRNHPPGARLLDIMNVACKVRRELQQHVDRMFTAATITRPQCHSLLEDVERGFQDGVRDAFAFPLGRCTLRAPYVPGTVETRAPLLDFDARMRLILVSSDYPPRPCGGVGVFIHNLATGLARLGHEVSVITRSSDSHTVDFEDGVWVHRIPATTHPGRTAPELPDLPDAVRDYAYSVYDEALRIQSIRGADTVLSSIWDLESAACVASSGFINLLYLVTSYKLSIGSKPEWKANNYYFENHVAKMIEGEKWILENCDRVIASTDGILKDFQEQYSFQLNHTPSIIPFGLPDCKTEVAKGRLKGGCRVLFVGRLEKRKGVHVLLEAIPGILSQQPEVELVLAGDNTLSVDGERLMTAFMNKHRGKEWLRQVKFLGYVDNDQLLKEYGLCDVFVAPSLYESFGLIYLEAMRHSKPCIGTCAGGIPDVVDESCGILVPPGDVESLREAIMRLVRNPELRVEMGNAGRRLFESKFSLDHFVSRISSEIRVARAPLAA